MNVLAFDLGLNTGWACSIDGRIESGTQDFRKKRGESNGMVFLNFNAWLHRVGVHVFPGPFPAPGLTVFEQAHHRGGHATEIAVGMSTRVMEFCARCRMDHAAVHSATLKKFATGNGRADKAAMLTAASAWAGRVVTDDNEADALLLLKYAQEEIVGGDGSHGSAEQHL